MKAAQVIIAITMVFATPRNGLFAQAPVAPIRDVVDEHFGVEVHDPYRYMEDIDAPEVQEWFRGQADQAHEILSQVKGRDALYKRLKELDGSKPYRIYSIRRREDGSLFYKKRMADENLPKLYYRSASGEEKMLVDAESFSGGGDQHYSIEAYSPSPDGRYVVYGLAAGGSEETVLHILDVTTGTHLDETIDRIETAYNRPRWLPDASGFFYARRQELPPNAPETEIYKNTRTYLHRLGDDPARDKAVFGKGLSDEVVMLDVDFPSINLPPGSKYAIGKIKHGDSNPVTLYSTLVSNLTRDKVPWRFICDASDEVVDYAVKGKTIYLLTSSSAPRYKVVKTSLARPNFDKAKVVVPESEMVVEYITSARDALYAGVIDGGFNRILRLKHGSKGGDLLTLPDDAAGYLASVSPTIEGALVYTNNWTRGSSIYAYDPGTGAYSNTGLMPPGRYDDVPGYTSREVKVKGHDGVLVPLSILHKEGLAMDGSNPTLLMGYGSYGISIGVGYRATRLAWLEQGGVLAYAHVRGGGEYGQAWHEAGKMLNKPNTWKDFIACAQYLIEEGYTSTEHIAGQGGSAGGITIGRSITERPDLFAAAVINVGMLDAIRAETTTNGVPNIMEFGSVVTEEGFRGLHEMSAYHHVKDGTDYPAVLLTHGINDPRVDPWMSGKMTARLQAATTSGEPVLLRIDYDAGHGIGSTRDQYLQQLADTWAFLLWKLGQSNFQGADDGEPTPL
ncbi:MAG: S9 family peptidase [Candidatus Marinimicrobia bacterium]|nr:S9 family peptidase [Candidatus Neomarinimicrobiota bacterium]